MIELHFYRARSVSNVPTIVNGKTSTITYEFKDDRDNWACLWRDPDTGDWTGLTMGRDCKTVTDKDIIESLLPEAQALHAAGVTNFARFEP